MTKEIQVTADDYKKTVTVRFRENTLYRLGRWQQVTFRARDFEKALADAKVAVPWSMVTPR